MTWEDLVAAVAKSSGVGAAEARSVLRAAFHVIGDEALHGRRVPVPGFGVFVQRRRATRTVRNPRTRELMGLPEVVSVGFRCSKLIKR